PARSPGSWPCAGSRSTAAPPSVMNVSIATVAEDVGTTVTGIQGAITAYTLVMAMFMIPGGKVGALIGRRRARTPGTAWRRWPPRRKH
ncbi:hypothetical protein AB0B44_44180, partial [Streptomyces sp. NPDC041003]